METLKKLKWSNVVVSLFLIAIGVCIFVWTGITAETLCVAIGVAALLFGILKLVSYFVRDVRGVGVNYDFSVGALAAIFGVIMLIHPQNVVELLQVLIGVYLLLDSVFKMQTAIDAKRIGVPGWWVTLIFTLVCMALGFMLIFRVYQNSLMYLIAVALIADGIQNLCMVIFASVASRAIERAERELKAEAVATTVPDAPVPPKPETPVAPPLPEAESAAELPQPEISAIHIAAPEGESVMPPVPEAPVDTAAAPDIVIAETTEGSNNI